MNPILKVKLQFSNEYKNKMPFIRNLRANAMVTTEKIDSLIKNLKTILSYYDGIPKIIKNMLVDVNYNDIIAKSNRIRYLFKPNNKDANDVVVGARFSDDIDGEEKHIITYYIDKDTINKTLEYLFILKKVISDKFPHGVIPENFNEKIDKFTKKRVPNINYEGYDISKEKIRNLIVDCSVVNSFSIPKIKNFQDKDNFLITFYNTELSPIDLLEKLGIDMKYRYFFYGKDTLSVSKELYKILEEKIPYLISMVSSDLSKMRPNEKGIINKQDNLYIHDPNNEPTIGVIDTLFDEKVYFSKWVQNTDYLDEIEKKMLKKENREHGTEVTSLIVDGPKLNPWLDDGCGNFRVRHFGVCENRISTANLVRKIKKIVSENPDIHVWNLSLGTEDEISKNFISYDAAALDELQAQKNVIFVISGTNDNRTEHPNILKVGSPADSLNSIVVNSVKKNGSPVSYSRRGTILSFFNKPDISYYGGDYNERIKVYSPRGICEEFGTSFAAPWIARKLCYLIDIMGLPREVAKALIVDSAAGWNYKISNYKNKDIIGYGVVPISIKDILTTKDDEIKFVVYGSSVSYKTTNYGIPIPKDDKNKYPYVARAVLCYFPECSRNQGVDYTNRELSLKFGRIDNKGTIDDINDNIQDDDCSYVDERQSREDFRKWENLKFISKILKKNKPLKSYDDRLWGLSITSKDRLNNRITKGLNFGVVITLKEICGINRISDFVKACSLRGWIVNYLNIQNQINVYNANQEEIEFE